MNLQLDLKKLSTVIAKKNNKEVLFGAWSHDELTLELINHCENICNIRGTNAFAIANTTDNNECSLHLDVSNRSKMQMICFRGYIVNGPIHTYSTCQDVFDYWDEDLYRKHNGVFSSVMLNNEGTELIMITDLFGISSLYYRESNGVIIFSSDPSLLYANNDEPDYIAWCMRLDIGYIPGDRSLINDVKRVPAGSILRFSSDQNSPRMERWYDIDKLSTPSDIIDDQTIDKFDQALTRSMERLSRIKWGDISLPLSSGNDSRLIFEKLIKTNNQFTTYTVQIAENTGLDVDGICASKMAHDYHVPHILVDMPDAKKYASSDVTRIFCVDAMTNSHSWSVPLFEHMKSKVTVIYDGLAGDVLGNGSKAWKCNNKNFSPNEKFKHIIQKLNPGNYRKYLKKSFGKYFPTVSSDLSKYYQLVTEGENQSEINYLLWQSRKSTSLWAQQQIDPGKVVLYPFLDLDYVELALSIPVSQKDKQLGQGRILQQVSPSLSNYPGTRNLPQSSPCVGSADEDNSIYSTQSLIKSCLTDKGMRIALRNILTKSHYILLWLSLYSKTICMRSQWWSKQLCEIVFSWKGMSAVYRIDG